MNADQDRGWLELAIELALESAEAGGPFGALVVQQGEVLGRGTNRVTADLDPTAHAEVVAIRGACRAVSAFSLAGATMYASCEPCPLCLAAALWARVSRVVYAADRRDAARSGFDDAVFHDVISFRGGTDLLEVVHVSVPGAQRPFEAWLSNPARVPY